MTPDEIIKKLDLAPLPDEGGYFRQTYKEKGNASTAIYYLVTPGSFSALHRLPKDEVFHFYLGDPVEMIRIDAKGNLSRSILGTDIISGHEPQVIAPANVWQGTKLLAGGRFALLGTTVAPGFEFSDFEIRTRAELTKLFPAHKDLIIAFTHS